MFPVNIPDCYIHKDRSYEHHVTAQIDLDKYVLRLKGTRPGLLKKYLFGSSHFVRILLPKSFDGITSMEQLKVVCDMKGLTKGSERRLPTRQLHMELDKCQDNSEQLKRS